MRIRQQVSERQQEEKTQLEKKNVYTAARERERERWRQEGGEEGTRQLLLHNMCCGQMVVNYVLRLLHCSCTFALE